MTNNKRLLELALKGLETERRRLDVEMAEIREQLGNGVTGARPRATPADQTASASKPRGLTAAGRRRLSMLMKKRWAERRKAAAKAGNK
jgi:hypothetical protein